MKKAHDEYDRDLSSLVGVLRRRLAEHPETEIAQHMPTSAWDKKLFEREGYDEMTMEPLQSTIYHYRFVSAWHEAIHTLAGNIDWKENNLSPAHEGCQVWTLGSAPTHIKRESFITKAEMDNAVLAGVY